MNQMEDLVSVIIPNYNYESYLEQCIESVISQSHHEIEIIVVDDGSTDNSVELLKQYRDRIRLIESKNQGAPSARNLGMYSAKGDLYAFLDADDYWHPLKIEMQLSFLKETNSDLVYCGMTEIGVKTSSSIIAKEGIDIDWFHKSPGSTPFAPSTALLTKELAARVGGWNTSLTSPAEDFDFFRRSSKYGKVTAQIGRAHV